MSSNIDSLTIGSSVTDIHNYLWVWMCTGITVLTFLFYRLCHMPSLILDYVNRWIKARLEIKLYCHYNSDTLQRLRSCLTRTSNGPCNNSPLAQNLETRPACFSEHDNGPLSHQIEAPSSRTSQKPFLKGILFLHGTRWEIVSIMTTPDAAQGCYKKGLCFRTHAPLWSILSHDSLSRVKRKLQKSLQRFVCRCLSPYPI